MSHTIQESEWFAGIGGMYRMTRFERDGRVKIELYGILFEVDRGYSAEMFVGYVPVDAWYRRNPCKKCGVQAHQGCRSVGLLTTKGSPCRTHINRKKT